MGHYEVRTWVGCHRHMTLCMLANMFSLSERIRVADDIPLLSARDVRSVLVQLINHPGQSRKVIYQTIAKRQNSAGTRRNIDTKRPKFLRISMISTDQPCRIRNQK